MTDTKSIERLNTLHPKIREAALKAYAESVKHTPIGVHPFITEGYRSFERSAELYKLGRTVVNPDGKSEKKPMGNVVSNSKAGQSYHNYGLALDFVLLVDGKESWVVDRNWDIVVDIFKDHGFFWGGDFTGTFKDYPHLENKLGHNWRELLELHNEGKFIPGTHFVQIP